MSVNNLTPKVRTKAKKVLNLAVKSKRSMKLNELNFVRTSRFIEKESKRISQPKIDKKKLKKLLNTDFASIASASLPGKGGGGLLGLLGDVLGGFGGGGGRRGGRRGGPPSRRAQQRYRRRFGNRAGNRRFGRMPQFGRGGGVRVPRAGGLLGVAMAGLEYGGRVSEGQTQTQAITGTAASTAGGIAGAYAGAKGGALLGAGIGALFGGVGAVPGAAIGGFLGGIAGGFGGSMIGGDISDRLTGVVGKDKDSEEAEKELEKKSKINPLGMTLDKFDQVVDRFAKAIVNLDLGGRIEESEDEPPKREDFPNTRSGAKAYNEARQRYRERQEERKAKIQEALDFEQNQFKKGQQERARVKTREQADKAGFGILEGILGEGIYDSLMKQVFFDIQPESKEPDATTKFLTNLGISPEAQGISAMLIETVLSAALMARGRGVMKPPAVKTRPLTKPTALQGPELPPVQRQPVSKPRVVRSADTLPRPEVKPTEPMVRQPAQSVQDVLNKNRRGRLKRTVNQVEKSQRRSEAELDAARDMAEGGFRRSQSTVKPQQNLIEGQTTLPDGSTVYYRRPMGRSAASRRNQLKSSKTSSETQTDSATKIMEREQLQVDADKLSDKVRLNQTIQDAIDQAARDAERVIKIKKKKKFSPSSTNPLEGKELSSINQYTTYNAPNNTTIIMQQGGNQMPPQSPPPQMMASAPPPTMPPGPSAIDVVSHLNTVIFLNNLQTT
tara:strand:+ start:4861 stop:7041 length:2181 start_codon:yes stop_codon:yes gene_type:complete